MKLFWNMEFLFSGILVLAKLCGIAFEDKICWVPTFAICLGGLTFVYAFIQYEKIKDKEAELTIHYMYGGVTSLLMIMAGVTAL